MEKQLRNLTDIVSSTILTFGAVRANVIWVDSEEGKAHKGSIHLITFCYCLIFLVDFVSKWFKHYSIYLAGERTEIVSNEAESRMLKQVI